MYYVYRDNMRMYLAGDEIVIKTWEKVYKFAADRTMFEAIQKLVRFIETPKTYEEIEVFFSEKRGNILNRAIDILVKAKVIIIHRNLDMLKNSLIFQYENADEIMKKMREKKVSAKNIDSSLCRKIQNVGMKITEEVKGDFLLIWQDGGMRELVRTFSQYRVQGKKMILAGEHNGNIYIISCGSVCRDISRAVRRISGSMEGNVEDHQRLIADKILESKCLEYFYADREPYNFTIIAPDLSVKNEWLDYRMPNFETVARAVFEQDMEPIVLWEEFHNTNRNVICFQHTKLKIYMFVSYGQDLLEISYGSSLEEWKEDSQFIGKEVSGDNITERCLRYLEEIGHEISETDLEVRDKEIKEAGERNRKVSGEIRYGQLQFCME